MSYAEPVQPTAPGDRPARPTVVTAATWLLWIVAALYLISAVATFATLGTVSEVLEEAYAGTSAEGQEGVGAASTGVSAGIFILFAIGFAVLGIFNNQGKNPSRIVTWVLGGVALCCTGVGLLLTGLLSGMEVEGGPDPAQIEEMLADRLPGWVDPVNWITQIGSILALIVALVLLALPAANEFFRKPPEEVFEPPPPNYPPPTQPPA